MTDEKMIIQSNEPLTRDVYRMVLAGNTAALTRPGQFINIRLEGFYLRRPISVCDYDGGSLTILYKTVGNGTRAMAELLPGKSLDVLMGLGNGFDPAKGGARPVLIGGGVGVPPLYRLCRELLNQGAKPTVILGFNCREEIFFAEEFRALGVKTLIATADGSVGVTGFVTDALREISDYTYFYTCGPLPMLKAVSDAAATSGQLSFEERMGCGFGACMGCSCKTKYGNKRICRDGPVLEKEEVIW